MSVSFGRWSAPQETRFQRFLPALMAGKTPLNTFFEKHNGELQYRQVSFPIITLQNLHSSPHLSSMHNVFPSLAFHKKRLLWKLRDYRNGKRGRQHTAKKHSLSGVRLICLGARLTIKVSSALDKKHTLPPPFPTLHFWFSFASRGLALP
jgi:hypothetical protein